MCKINFRTQFLLSDHDEKQHPKQAYLKFKCTKCSRHFEAEENWVEHNEYHKKNDKQYNCDECDHQTTDEARLEKHF